MWWIKDLPYGIDRMYQAYSDQADSMTFRVYRSPPRQEDSS